MQVTETTPSAPVRVAIVGAGSMGTNHLRVLRDLPEGRANVVGVAESYPESRARAERIFHIPGFADYKTMISQTKPDLVVVVTPTVTHFEVASFALNSGCNVLVEKPIAHTVAEAEELVRLARLKGLVLAVGHVEHFNPAVRHLKKLLEEEKLGRIYQLVARRMGPFSSRIRDVGVTLDLATHDLDVMRFVTGSDVRTIFAQTQHLVKRDYEDILLGVLRFDSDAVGVLEVNRMTPAKTRELTLTGDHGMFYLNYITQELSFTSNDVPPSDWAQRGSVIGVSDGEMTRYKIDKGEPLRLEYEDVLRAVTTRTEPGVTGESGLVALRIAHDILESAKTGEVITCAATIQVM